MFAILGINLMKGKMNYCSLPPDSTLSIYDVRENDVNKIIIHPFILFIISVF